MKNGGIVAKQRFFLETKIMLRETELRFRDTDESDPEDYLAQVYKA